MAVQRLRRGVLSMSDTGDDILVQCDMQSEAAVTAAGGTVVGTAANIINDQGYQPISSEYVHFSALTGYGKLDYAGQIVFEVEVAGVTMKDGNATSVSLSEGYDLSAAEYIVSMKDSGSTLQMYMYRSTAEQLTIKFAAADSNQTIALSSYNSPDWMEICIWWSGSTWGLIVNGAPLGTTYTRTSVANLANKIALGVGGVYNSQWANCRFRNLRIGRRPPQFAASEIIRSIGIDGDSFAYQTDDSTVPRFQNTTCNELRRLLAADGLRARVYADGHPNYTICVTGSNDLADTLTDYVATNPQIAVIMALNNDVIATDAAVDHATNGTEAQLKARITAIDANPINRLIIVCTAGSLQQADSTNTDDNNARLRKVNTIARSMPAWWDAANPSKAGKVVVYDLYRDLGDKKPNMNHQGEWNLIGNGVNTPARDDRHPSPQAHVFKIARSLYRIIREYVASDLQEIAT